jgi:uncharacterized protein YutE (UPF0331/DUF86 family)
MQVVASGVAVAVGDATERERFEILAYRMARMVGFRNVAVHDYQRLNLDIVKAIIVERLDDFRAFGRVALEQARRAS